MTDTDLSPSGTYAAPLPSVRSRQQGGGLARLRAWRRCRDCGADEAAREAALSGLSGPIQTDPLSKEQ